MAVGSSLDEMVTALVPSLSRSLAEQFNVFRVMHHGTHEKQLSNVFAWLLSADGTHSLGDAFQQLFVERVNQRLTDAYQLPAGGYQVVQEIDTSGTDDLGGDIADIVLTSPSARVGLPVVMAENPTDMDRDSATASHIQAVRVTLSDFKRD